MIIRGITIVLFVLIGVSTNAQDWSLDKYKYGELYKGYVIDNEGTRIDGYIKYRNRWVMQNEVIFYKRST